MTLLDQVRLMVGSKIKSLLPYSKGEISPNRTYTISEVYINKYGIYVQLEEHPASYPLHTIEVLNER